MVLEGLGVVDRGVLTAGIAVMATSATSAPGARWCSAILKASRTSVVRMCWRELPADDLAAVGVDHEAEEHQALPAAQIGEVGEPHLIRPGRLELALHRSGLRIAEGSARVVRHGLPRRLAPCSPFCASAVRHGCARPARRSAAAPSTSAVSHRRSSCARVALRSRRAAAHPPQPGLSAGRWLAGSRRTPTRPGSRRSARPRNARDAPR